VAEANAKAGVGLLGWVLRLCWVLSLVALGMTLVAIWRGRLDPEALKFLASSVGGAVYLTFALVCAAAGSRRGFALLKLGQLVAVVALLFFLAGLWGKSGDLVLWVRLWGTSTLMALAFAHSGSLVLALKPLWMVPIAVVTASSTWVLCVGLSWMLWTFRFDDPFAWKVGLTCMLVSSLGSFGVLGGHVYTSVKTRVQGRSRRDSDNDDDD